MVRSSPAGPVGRTAPGHPDGPVGRTAPGHPAGPVGRTAPGHPAGPVGRTAPRHPDGPVGRTAPAHPVVPICQAGRSLIALWNLPDAFLGITAGHHEPGAQPTGTASFIPPSCELADALGFAVIRCRSPRSYAEIIGAFPEPARNPFPADAKQLASEIASEVKGIEFA